MDLNEGGDFDAGEDVQMAEGVRVEKTSSGSSVDFIDKDAFISVISSIHPQIGVEKIILGEIGRSQSYCRNMLDEITK